MSELVPVASPGTSLLAPLRTASGGSVLTRLRTFAAQPPVRKALPWFAGIAGVGVLALIWAGLSSAPQRVLYSSLSDAERADVAAALDKASIGYTIDNATGALTVGEDDLYRARMTVASDGALAAPESGAELIDSLPMGASRTLEGDRLRAAQERELQMTIMEIDGVEAVGNCRIRRSRQSPISSPEQCRGCRSTRCRSPTSTGACCRSRAGRIPTGSTCRHGSKAS